jgi:hypothetical protein
MTAYALGHFPDIDRTEMRCREADTLITSKASSFSRNAAAAGRAFGLEVHVVLAGSASEQNCASQALFREFETVWHYVRNADQDAMTAEYDRVLRELTGQVYELHPGGSG